MRLPANITVKFLPPIIIALAPLLLLCGNSRRCRSASPQDELRGVKKEIREKQHLIKKTRKVEAAVSSELKEIMRSSGSEKSQNLSSLIMTS
jgi:murein hydrolase activator